MSKSEKLEYVRKAMKSLNNVLLYIDLEYYELEIVESCVTNLQSIQGKISDELLQDWFG